jgi:hypothetical protein
MAKRKLDTGEESKTKKGRPDLPQETLDLLKQHAQANRERLIAEKRSNHKRFLSSAEGLAAKERKAKYDRDNKEHISTRKKKSIIKHIARRY